MRKNKRTSRTLALFLSLIMLITGLTPAWAEEIVDITTPTDVSELVLEEQPAEVPEEVPSAIPSENPDMSKSSIPDRIATYGHAYVTTAEAAKVYGTAAMEEVDLLYTITQTGAILLATEYDYQAALHPVRVWFLTEAAETLTGYVAEEALADKLLTDEEALARADTFTSAVSTDAGSLSVFAAAGEWPNVEEQGTVPPAETAPISFQIATPDVLPEQPIPNKTEEAIIPEPDPFTNQVGDFVMVTTNTRVFLGVDESASEDYTGELNMGVFVRDAVVQVEAIEQDVQGREWYRVRYLYGDDFADGRLKWTETSVTYVLAAETSNTEAQALTVTDYAFAAVPTASRRRASAMDGFTLKSINGSIGTFTVGQNGVYGSSGKDSAYKQIATVAGHGTVYATPHYLNGFTVYCLEHNLPGPGENISGGGQQPKGPYLIVDIDSYMNTPGNSKVIYHESTMHAIAWVLRHTYPFMVLDRSDADNETWSRVAGQFAIREVIKQLEGAQYVRDYWDMDNFYTASGQAPAVYLTYARWLAANGVARAAVTGEITVSNQATSVSNGMYVGTATLNTDADLIRISKSYGRITGHTAGEDSAYYYLHSGDTISVFSDTSAFSLVGESVSSEEEEAGFLVGVPDAEIQKVLIPQQGVPYKLQSTTLHFEVLYGAVAVTKTDAASGAALAGATFELLNSAGQVVQALTTDASGTATFSDLRPGTYTVRESAAPTGYVLSVPATQPVTVTAGNTSSVAFGNELIQSRIRIVKRDRLTREPLAGAEFTITRLSSPEAVAATITTGADGTAETGWLTYGKYRIVESKVPAHYVDGGFSTEIEAYENGRTYVVEVENEPAKGWLRLTKTDSLNGNPIEGVQFDIYHSDEYGEELAATMTTGADGVAMSPPLRKGRYIVKEHGATAGYVFETVTLEATVKSDEITELKATNLPVQVKLTLYKRDADELIREEAVPAPITRGDGVLTGAEFQVRTGEDITDRQGNVLFTKGSVVVESLNTAGEDASVTTGNLWPGLYEILEISPPMGYQPGKAPIYVDARAAAEQSTETVITYEGAVTNEILYGALAIVKVLGSTEPYADPQWVETPEPGAEFAIYLKSAGSYDQARDFERDYLITDENGYAMTKALPYGVYTIRQTKGKDGYEIKGPIDVQITGTENLVNPPIVPLSDQPIRYRLRFIKTDAETGKSITLAQASFKLKDADGRYATQKVFYPNEREIDTFTTDETGAVTLPETVTWGLYFVEEIQAPEGYLIRDEDFAVFVGSAGDKPGETYQLDIAIPNEPVKGRILLDKHGLQLTGFGAMTDANGHVCRQPVYKDQYLAGATFEVRAAERIIGQDGTVWYEKDELADTIVTTAHGHDTSKPLPLGKYYIMEIEAPEGYVFESIPLPVELAYADDTTPLVEAVVMVGNDYLPAEICLRKKKEIIQTVQQEGDLVIRMLTIAPGQGFVFGLYNDKDIAYSGGTLMADTLIATGTTDENGAFIFSGYYPHGSYYIRELSAPTGWKLNPNRFEITLNADSQVKEQNVIRVSLPEAIRNELIYTPVTLTKTDITGETTIPGALIEVQNSDGEIIYRAYTDKNGEIPDIPVVPGAYTFREVLAPEGFALNEAVMTFSVNAEGNVTGDTAIRDDDNRVSVRKEDEKGLPLGGAVFGLYSQQDELLMTAVSDAKGFAQFERIPNGHYTIREIQAPEGYLISREAMSLTMDGTFINPTGPLATITNAPPRIMLLKADTSGNPIPGVTFSLISAATGEVVQTAVSDENGLNVDWRGADAGGDTHGNL